MPFPVLSDQSRQSYSSISIIVGNVELAVVGADSEGYGALYAGTNFEMNAAAQPGTCMIVCRDPKHELSFTTGDLIQLRIDGERVWRGILMRKSMGTFTPVGDARTPTRVRRWTLYGVDLNIILDKFYVYNRKNPALQPHNNKPWKPGTMDRDIIVDVWKNDCDVDKLPFGINAVSKVGEVGQAIFGSKQDGGGIIPFGPGASLRGFMELVGKAVYRSTPGAVIWYIDGEGYLVYMAQDDAVASFSVSDNGATDVAARDMVMTEDISNLKTDALVFANTLNPDITQKVKPFVLWEHKIGDLSHGRWQYAEIQPHWSQAWLKAHATKIITQEGTPAKRVEFTIFRPGLWPGQIVTCASDAFGVVENVPIRQITLTFPAPGIVSFRVTASFDTGDPWGLLLALRRPTQRGFVEPRFQTFDPTQWAPADIPSVQPWTYISEIPRKRTSRRYQTTKAYMAGSLAVYVDGIFFIQGDQYDETDPDAGVFTFKAVPPSSKIYVAYHVSANLTAEQVT